MQLLHAGQCNITNFSTSCLEEVISSW